MNPYKVLGLDENATQADIKAAYRKLSKEKHPDQGGDQKAFIEIKKAYEILSNKETRSTFDLYGISIDFLKEAKELGFTIFFEVFNQLPDGEPLDFALKRFIEEQIPKYEKEMKDLEEKKIRLQKRLLRIIKKPEDDFITETSCAVIDRYTTDYKIALLQRDLYKKSLELLTEYEFDHLQINDHVQQYRRSYAGNSIMKHFDMSDYLRKMFESETA